MKISGIGVHSGQHCQVELVPKATGGININLIQKEKRYENFWSSKSENNFNLIAQNSTIIQNQDCSLATSEHLMAVLHLFGHKHFDLNIKGVEVPILDGSSMPWLSTLISLFGSPQIPQFRNEILKPYFWGNETSSVEISEIIDDSMEDKSSKLIVDYTLDTDGIQQNYIFDSSKMEDWIEVLSARTFIDASVFEALKSKGILKGAQIGNGIMYRTNSNIDSSAEKSVFEVVNGAPLRNDNEFVLHKILDLLGDVFIYQKRLKSAYIKVVNGGHWLNHQILMESDVLGALG